MSKYIGDLCYSTGEYEKDGEKKKRWSKAAAVFKNEETGSVTYKFESLPAGEWSGWMRFFPDKRDKKSQDVAPSDVPDDPIDLSEIPF